MEEAIEGFEDGRKMEVDEARVESPDRGLPF